MMVRAPCLRAISASTFASELTPVDVSACTKASNFASGLALNASSTFCALTGVPQRSSTTTATPPPRRHRRPPPPPPPPPPRPSSPRRPPPPPPRGGFFLLGGRAKRKNQLLSQ